MSTRNKRNPDEPFIKLTVNNRKEAAVDQKTGEKVMGLHRTPPRGAGGPNQAADGQQQQQARPPPPENNSQTQDNIPGETDDPFTNAGDVPPTAPPPEEDIPNPNSARKEETPQQPSSSTAGGGSNWKEKLSAHSQAKAKRRLDDHLDQVAQDAAARQRAQDERDQRRAQYEREQEMEQRRREQQEKEETRRAAQEERRAKERMNFDEDMSSKHADEEEEQASLIWDFANQSLLGTSTVSSGSEPDWDDLYDDDDLADAEDGDFDEDGVDIHPMKDPKTLHELAQWLRERARKGTHIKPIYSGLNEETIDVVKAIINTSKKLDATDKERLAHMVEATSLPRKDKASENTMLYNKRIGKVYIPLIAIPALPNLQFENAEAVAQIESYYRPLVETLKRDRIKLNMEKLEQSRFNLLQYGSLLGMELARKRIKVRMALVYFYMGTIIQLAMMETAFTMAIYESLMTLDENLVEEHKYRLAIYSSLAKHWQKALRFMKTSMLQVPKAGVQVLMDSNIEYAPLYNIPPARAKEDNTPATYLVPSKNLQADARLLYAHRLLQQKRAVNWLTLRFRKLVKKRFTDQQARVLLKREAALDNNNNRQNRTILQNVGLHKRYARNTLQSQIGFWVMNQDLDELLKTKFDTRVPDAVYLAISFSEWYRYKVAKAFTDTLAPRTTPASDGLKLQMLMVAQYYSLEKCRLTSNMRWRDTMEFALRWANGGMILRQWDNITMEEKARIRSGKHATGDPGYKQRANMIGYNALVHGKLPDPAEISLPSYEEAMGNPKRSTWDWTKPNTAAPTQKVQYPSLEKEAVHSSPIMKRPERPFSPIPGVDQLREQEKQGNLEPNPFINHVPDKRPAHDDTFDSMQKRSIPVSAEALHQPKRQEGKPSMGLDSHVPPKIMEKFVDEPLLPHQRRVYVGRTENPGWQTTVMPRPADNAPPYLWDRWHMNQLLKKDVSEEIPVPKFNGDISKFITYWETFTAVVDHNPHLEQIVKFIKLKKSLGDEPLRKIAFLDTTAYNYEEAKRIITEHYGRVDDIYKVWESKFKGSPSMTREATYSEMENFYITVRRLISSVKQFCPEKLNDRSLIDLVESKLDRTRFRAWRKVLKAFWRESSYCEQVYNEITHQCLLRFLKDEYEDIREAEKYNDQQKAARVAAVENPKRFKSLVANAKNVTAMMATTFKGKRENKNRNNGDKKPVRKNSSPPPTQLKKQSPRVAKCLFCKMTHDLKQCKNTTVDQRLAILEKEGRCRICFKQHPMQSCPSKKTCEKCGMKNHHTAVHKDLVSKSKPQPKQKK